MLTHRDKSVGEDITKRRFDIVGKLLGSPTFNARMNALKEVPVPTSLTTALLLIILFFTPLDSSAVYGGIHTGLPQR